MELLPSRIWFLLYDASTSLPYMGTTATSVSLPPGSNVAEFRKVVKVKEADIITVFGASQLVVYKNKLSFDKRNDVAAAGKKGMGKPLEEDLLVDGLGTSVKEAMIVIVPSLSQVFRIQPTAFPLCPNLQQYLRRYGRDGWLLFRQNILGTSWNKLYIRECYRTIATNIYHDVKKSIVNGTPGIGKSHFLIYLLWTLVKEGKRVLFIYHSFNVYYDGKGGVFQVTLDRKLLYPDESFWNDTLWCLLNAKGKNDIALNPFPYDMCKFVLSTSPRRELVNDFKKSFAPPNFVMPIWTETELEVIAPSFPHAIEWRNRFAILGGIPRYVLEVTTKTPREILEAACAACSLDDCIKKFTRVTTLRLRRIQRALNIIVARKGEEARLRIKELIANCERNPLIAALCGCIYEPYAIELLEKGGTFKCRQLVRGTKKDKPSETLLHISSSSTRRVVTRVEYDQQPNMLHVPETWNGATFDAWIPGIGAFQMAFGKNHEIKGDARMDLSKVGEPNILYWCLPRVYYDSFMKQNPQDIDQYAILIPSQG